MFRIDPLMPVGAYQTYSVSAPRSTHFRAASCAEVGCTAYVNGWQSTVDESVDPGIGQGWYIRRESGRRYTEERLPDGRTRFTFEPGQRCFGGQHQVRLDRPEIYVVRGGDWRAHLGDAQQMRAEDWVDHFATHQQRLADTIGRG